MTVQSSTTLKTYFETGDKPTQAQFIDLIDTVFGGDKAASTVIETGGTESRTLANRFADSLSIYDFGSGGNATFVAACASGKHVIVPSGTYTLSGSFPFASGTVLELQGATINIDTGGASARGFVLYGVSDAYICGYGTINASASTLGTDGSYNSAVSIGSTFYVASTPTITQRCGVKGGQIKINSTGTENVKLVGIYGYVDEIDIDISLGTGQSNYAIGAHWVRDGASGSVPTKTWHPDHLRIRARCEDTSSGALLRAFTASACGRVEFNGCNSVNSNTLGFVLFAGDYGFTYAQNLSEGEYMQYTINGCSHSGLYAALSVDGLTTGVDGSPIWSGADHGARVVVNGFRALMSAGSDVDDIGITCVDTFIAKNLFIEEDSAGGSTNNSMLITGVKNVHVEGKISSQHGVLIRDCGTVEWKADVKITPAIPDTTSYCVAASASSETTTVDGEVAAQATSITLDSVADTYVAGGILRYVDGGGIIYEMNMLSLAYAGDTQTITISPAPVTIPNDATVTLIKTVKKLVIDKSVELSGARTPVWLNGDATAKPRNVDVQCRIRNGGIADILATAVNGFNFSADCDGGGQTTTTTTTYGVSLGAYAENGKVASSFGKNCTRVKFQVAANNSALNALIDGNVFQSLGTTSGAATISQGTSSSVFVGANNIHASGVTPSGCRILFGASTPATEGWPKGTIVLNTAPSAGGKIGSVNVGDSTTATWKTWGAIDA